MKGRASRRGLLAFFLGALLAPRAAAHRSRAVLSTIDWNAAAGALDISHRLHGHDAEVALMRSGAMPAGEDLTQIRAQARLGLYLQERFRLTGPTGVISTEILAAEIDGAEIVVYQSARLTVAPDPLTIDNQILRETFEDQTNLVNVRLGDGVRTLMFAGSDGPKSVRRRT
jgi:hypothetical protein